MRCNSEVDLEFIKRVVRGLDPLDSGLLRAHTAFFNEVSDKEKDAFSKFVQEKGQSLNSDSISKEIFLGLIQPLSSEVAASPLEVLFRLDKQDVKTDVNSNQRVLGLILVLAHLVLAPYFFFSEDNLLTFNRLVLELNLNDVLGPLQQYYQVAMDQPKRYQAELEQLPTDWQIELSEKHRRQAFFFTWMTNPSFRNLVSPYCSRMDTMPSASAGQALTERSDQVTEACSGFAQAIIRPVLSAHRSRSLKKEWERQFNRAYTQALLGEIRKQAISQVKPTTRTAVLYFYHTLLQTSNTKQKTWQDVEKAFSNGDWKALLPWFLAFDYAYHQGLQPLMGKALAQLGRDVYRLEAWQNRNPFRRFPGFKYEPKTAKKRSLRITAWVQQRHAQGVLAEAIPAVRLPWPPLRELEALPSLLEAKETKETKEYGATERKESSSKEELESSQATVGEIKETQSIQLQTQASRSPQPNGLVSSQEKTDRSSSVVRSTKEAWKDPARKYYGGLNTVKKTPRRSASNQPKTDAPKFGNASSIEDKSSDTGSQQSALEAVIHHEIEQAEKMRQGSIGRPPRIRSPRRSSAGRGVGLFPVAADLPQGTTRVRSPSPGKIN